MMPVFMDMEHVKSHCYGVASHASCHEQAVHPEAYLRL